MHAINKNEEEQHVERVIVSVRLRPFTEEEYLRDRQSCIENFDVNNKIILGKMKHFCLISFEK